MTQGDEKVAAAEAGEKGEEEAGKRRGWLVSSWILTSSQPRTN